MTTDGDELLGMIREIVDFHGVPEAHKAVVVDTAGRVILTVLTSPHFYERLKFVNDLRVQNEMLRQQLAQVSALVYRANLQPVKKRPIKRAAKKTAAKKTAAKPVVRNPRVITNKTATHCSRGAWAAP